VPVKTIFSKAEIRKFLVFYYGLDKFDTFGTGKAGILNYLQRVNTLQFDPLDIAGRNVDIILKSRFSNYSRNLLDELMYRDFQIVDGFDKEASIHLIDDWGNFSYVRKELSELNMRILNYRGTNEALEILESVHKHVIEHPNTFSSDVKIKSENKNSWGSSNLFNCALNQLWAEGKLIVSSRKGSIKGFTVTEAIVPTEFRDSIHNSHQEFMEWYVLRRLESLGVYWLKRGPGWLGFHLKDIKVIQSIVGNLVEQGLLIEVEIEGMKENFYLTKANYDLLLNYSNTLLHNNLRFIAPLDNLIWDRDLVKALFNFDYKWEVYVPEEKRKFGYYVLPVLYEDRFIGRLEPSRDKKRTNKLEINRLWFENPKDENSQFKKLIDEEVARFNGY